MTNEQIAELHRLTGLISWTDGDIEALSQMLPRLLLERQRLLDGCKQAAVQHRSMPLNYDEWERFIYGIIEYAEQPFP